MEWAQCLLNTLSRQLTEIGVVIYEAIHDLQRIRHYREGDPLRRNSGGGSRPLWVRLAQKDGSRINQPERFEGA